MDTEYISAITALGAVILSPLIAFYTVKTQTKANIVSTNRQKWIDDLRNTLSEYISVMHTANQARAENMYTKEEMLPLLQKVFELDSKIMLLLNPNESKHNKINELITQARVVVFKSGISEFDPTKWNEIWADIMRTAKSILKEEWEIVKSGK